MGRKLSSQQAQQAPWQAGQASPAGQASRKHKASQAIAPVIAPRPRIKTGGIFRNEILFNEEDDRNESESESDSDSDSDSNSDKETIVDAAVLAPGVGKGTRAFSAIPSVLQPFASTTKKIVTKYTLYKKPLLTPGEILLLIQHAWSKAQTEPCYVERVKEVDTFVCITKVYDIGRLSRESMKTQVEYLLDGDRFICRQSSRSELKGRFRTEEIVAIIYQWYFKGPKMQGNRDPDFLNKVNGIFICFVASAMHHSLKAWRKGEIARVMQEFKYETAWCTYERLKNTWEIHLKAIQELIVNNIKADLARRIAAQVRIVEIESVDVPQVEDEAQYEAELRKELEYSYDRLRVPAHKRRREGSQLRDSSVELAGPLDPSVDDELEESGDIDKEGGDLDSGSGDLDINFDGQDTE
ncbi:hypothetical protein L211DRAFT_854246 [Terfezia boudieri ATCC MYA-4762]|uniref:DUF6532 domain-containing protein n=1 Tax=Terfezia boudieri ATCC MYA-4762 TaxID=1051890 RepID=A0A3N4LA13_9PEZI|nr:hypothetical protein L211DRAFT_854246 [Terfezia boudieri ATCC MYA-4762]